MMKNKLLIFALLWKTIRIVLDLSNMPWKQSLLHVTAFLKTVTKKNNPKNNSNFINEKKKSSFDATQSPIFLFFVTGNRKKKQKTRSISGIH